MSETPQSVLERYIRDGGIITLPHIREAIRAVLAENVSLSEELGEVLFERDAAVQRAEDCCRMGEKTCAELVAERDALRAEVERQQKLIYALETQCDPAGDQRNLILTRDENAMLRKRVEVAWITAREERLRAERAEAALMDALHDCALTYDAAGDLDYLSRAVEAEAALRWCDEFAPGIVEQARAALRDPAPLPTSQPARAIEVCKRAATAPAEGFFARGDDGHYRTDPAPACACGIPGAGKARECHGDYYGGETFAMDPGGEFKETNVCKCGCHRDSAPAEEP